MPLIWGQFVSAIFEPAQSRSLADTVICINSLPACRSTIKSFDFSSMYRWFGREMAISSNIYRYGTFDYDRKLHYYDNLKLWRLIDAGINRESIILINSNIVIDYRFNYQFISSFFYYRVIIVNILLRRIIMNKRIITNIEKYRIRYWNRINNVMYSRIANKLRNEMEDKYSEWYNLWK